MADELVEIYCMIKIGIELYACSGAFPVCHVRIACDSNAPQSGRDKG